MLLLADPARTPVSLRYSRSFSFSVDPEVSERTHSDATYAPVAVVATQFGESFSWHAASAVPPFASSAAQSPLWPASARVSVTPAPDPEAFHPEVSVSKEPFLTTTGASTPVVAPADCTPAPPETATNAATATTTTNDTSKPPHPRRRRAAEPVRTVSPLVAAARDRETPRRLSEPASSRGRD